MSNVINIRRPRPFRILDAGDLHGKPVPERDWLVPGVLVRGGITMLSGDGGMGKSLLALQLQVAAALGEPWLGLDLPRDGITSLGWYCEDEEDELHRRLYDLARHYGVDFDRLAGRVLYDSRVGEDNTLMAFDYRKDSGATRPAFQQIEETVRLHGVELIIIDTIADTFQGNENIRPQVRAYVNAMRKLALINRGGVILAAHPSRSGLADGSGQSGSTGWNGSVRSRIYLTRPKAVDKDIDGEDEPTDERLLKVMKSNYGPAGDKLRLKWQQGVFVRTDLASTSPGFLDRLDDDRKLVDAAEYFIRNGTLLSPDPKARTGLVNVARSLPTCRHLSWTAAISVQDRLLDAGKLVRVELGPRSRRRVYVRPAHLRYPGEDEAGATENEHPSVAQTTNGGPGGAC